MQKVRRIMDKEHKVSVYDMVKELNLKEVTPEINSREVYIEQAEINRPALQLAGFFENFAKNRVQIIGKAEHLFIEEVEKDVENAKNIYNRFIGAEFQRSYFAETFIQVRCC